MTSKRTGLLLALLALWSLAGLGSFVSTSNTLDDVGLGVSLAYAGDPDDYTAPQVSSPDGDPDDYTDPVPADEDDSSSKKNNDDEVDDVNTYLEIALILLFGIY